MTPGERTELRTVAPELIDPVLTRELKAWPVRPPSYRTNLAGGSVGSEVQIGNRVVYSIHTGEAHHS